MLCEYTCASFLKLKCGLSSMVSNSFHLIFQVKNYYTATSVDNQGLLVQYFNCSEYNHVEDHVMCSVLLVIKTLSRGSHISRHYLLHFMHSGQNMMYQC